MNTAEDFAVAWQQRLPTHGPATEIDVRQAVAAHDALLERIHAVDCDVMRARNGRQRGEWVSNEMPDFVDISPYSQTVTVKWMEFHSGYYNGIYSREWPLSYLWDADPWQTERKRIEHDEAVRWAKQELARQQEAARAEAARVLRERQELGA